MSQLGEHDWVRLPHDYASIGTFFEFFECAKCQRRKTGEDVRWDVERGAVAGYYHVADPHGCLGQPGQTPFEAQREAETNALMARLAAEREAEDGRLRGTVYYRRNRYAVDLAKATFEAARDAGEDAERIYQLAVDDAEAGQ